MIRRAFLSAVASAAVAVALPVPVEAATPKAFRRWCRFDYPTDAWVPIRFEDIKAGMVIWVEDVGHPDGRSEVVTAYSDSRVDPDGSEYFQSYHAIDSATNQWVPVGTPSVA